MALIKECLLVFNQVQGTYQINHEAEVSTLPYANIGEKWQAKGKLFDEQEKEKFTLVDIAGITKKLCMCHSQLHNLLAFHCC